MNKYNSYLHPKWLVPLGLLVSLLSFNANAANVDCSSADPSVNDLQAAITAATSGDTINVSGTCATSIGYFIRQKSITLNGVPTPANPHPTISGPGTANSRIISVTLSTGFNINLKNLTITNGDVGVYHSNGNLTISNCLINSINFYGIYQLGGDLSLSNSTVAGTLYGVYIDVIDGSVSKYSNNTIAGATAAIRAVGGTVSDFSRNILVGPQGVQSTTMTINSNGYNAIGYILFSGAISLLASDVAVSGGAASVGLQSFGDNGGPTQTRKLVGGPAVGIVPLGSDPSCPFVTPPAPPYSSSDQRGAPRPGATSTGPKMGCDAGAYETGEPRLVMNAGNFVDLGTFTKGQTVPAPTIEQFTNIGNDAVSGFSQPSVTPGPFSAVQSDLSAMQIGDTREVSLSFLPTQDGVYSGLVNILPNGGLMPLFINLTGTATGFTVTPPPTDPVKEITDLITTINTDISNGSLVGVSTGKTTSASASAHVKAFNNLLTTASDQITAGIITTGDSNACTTLSDAYQKADGIPKPPDFISGSGRAAVADQIQSLMNQLHCPQAITPTL